MTPRVTREEALANLAAEEAGATHYVAIPAGVRLAYKIPEAAKVLGISTPTLKEALLDGRGPKTVRLGSGRRPHVLIPVESLRTWLTEKAAPHMPARANWFVTPEPERTKPWDNAKGRRKAEAGETSGAAA